MPNDYRHTGRPNENAHPHGPVDLSPGAAPSVYQATLLEIIESTSNDPSQLRRLVYELARANLKRETWQREPALTPAAVRECMIALETAIERVEADFWRGEQTDAHFPRLDSDLAGLAGSPTHGQLPEPRPERLASNARPLPGANWVVHRETENDQTGTAVAIPLRPRDRVVLRTQPTEPLRARPVPARAERPHVEIVYPERETSHAAHVRRRVWLWFIVWPLIQLAVPAVLMFALYTAISGRLAVQPVPAPKTVEPQPGSEETAGARPPGLPLPSSYGVYAVSNGRLNALTPLPIRAPDARVALSAEIRTPSATTLPDGHVAFVVFRRDLLNSAPEKAAIRVVARVAHATTVSAAKTTRVDVDGSWRIRSNSYDFRVSPLGENHEMIAIRPETDDFALPAGRYALVLGGAVFDFTIDGPITAAAQCLESFEAVGGPVYTECPPK